jgi:hypothetical protein
VKVKIFKIYLSQPIIGSYTEEDRRLDDQTIAKLLAEEGEQDA